MRDVVVIGFGDDTVKEKYKSWLELLWDGASQDLINKYSRQQFHIRYEKLGGGWLIDKIIISRM